MTPRGRANDAMRPVTLERGVARQAEGSCLVRVREHARAVRRLGRGWRSRLAEGPRRRVAHRRVRDAAARHAHAHVRASGASSADARRRSSGSSGAACARCSTTSGSASSRIKRRLRRARRRRRHAHGGDHRRVRRGGRRVRLAGRAAASCAASPVKRRVAAVSVGVVDGDAAPRPRLRRGRARRRRHECGDEQRRPVRRSAGHRRARHVRSRGARRPAVDWRWQASATLDAAQRAALGAAVTARGRRCSRRAARGSCASCVRCLRRAGIRRAVDLREAGVAEAPDEDALEALRHVRGERARQGAVLPRADRACRRSPMTPGSRWRRSMAQPGVRSKRWCGRDRPQRAGARRREQRHAARGAARRGAIAAARYVCAAAYVRRCARGCRARRDVRARSCATRAAANGFGYDPYFFSDELGATFGESIACGEGAGESSWSRVSRAAASGSMRAALTIGRRSRATIPTSSRGVA